MTATGGGTPDGTGHGDGPAAAYWLERAWLGFGAEQHPEHDPAPAVADGVLVEVAADGTVAAVRPGTPRPAGAVALAGLTVPGLADAHSHAFHRALRSVTQRGAGTFWTWRDVMYGVADRLTPDSYRALARALYAEMALAGITAVGEFHYLHHAPGGARYADPNAMGRALIEAARDGGPRLTLLDTAYLSSGFGAPPDAHQLRFSDGSAAAWAERAALLADDPALRADPHILVGAAVHSVRAVPAPDLPAVAGWAAERDVPLHVHLSEQTAENEACAAAHRCTPARLLADHGVLGPGTTAVHATHLTAGDVALLGDSGTGVCMCPTTERDLADGIGPARQLQRAGSPLALGSDSHAVVDLLEEARALELDERLARRTRGHWTAAQALHAATAGGYAALGRAGGGRIAHGAPADFATLATDTVRMAGAPADALVEAAVFAATAADVRHTVVGGRQIVRDGVHLAVPDTAGALARAVAGVLAE